MKRNFATAILISIILALVLGFALTSVTSISVSAQNASSKTVPRLPNGKPDFTGTWDHPRVADVTKDVKGRCVGETPRGPTPGRAGWVSRPPARPGRSDRTNGRN